MKNLLIWAAIFEIGTGLVLALMPAFVGQLLLGDVPTGLAVPIARVAGLALLGLGLSGWPGPSALGLTVYYILVALYLGWLGIAGTVDGVLLWPVVVFHAAFGAIMLRDLLRGA